MKLIEGSFKDESLSTPGQYNEITAQVMSAFTDLGSAQKNKHVIGYEAIADTDAPRTGENGLVIQADFGRKATTRTSPALQSGFQNILYSAALRGTFFQYRFKITLDIASTIGWKLYHMGILVK